MTTATPRFNGGGDNRFVLVSLVAVTTALFVCYSGGGDNRLFVTGGGDNRLFFHWRRSQPLRITYLAVTTALCTVR